VVHLFEMTKFVDHEIVGEVRGEKDDFEIEIKVPFT